MRHVIRGFCVPIQTHNSTRQKVNLSLYLKYLTMTVVACVAIFYVLVPFLPLSPFTDIMCFSILSYVVLASIIYILIELSLKTNEGRSIIGLVMFNVLLKLICTFGLAIVYAKYANPPSKLFLIPIISTYLLFTAFETWFMTVQSGAIR